MGKLGNVWIFVAAVFSVSFLACRSCGCWLWSPAHTCTLSQPFSGPAGTPIDIYAFGGRWWDLRLVSLVASHTEACQRPGHPWSARLWPNSLLLLKTTGYLLCSWLANSKNSSCLRFPSAVLMAELVSGQPIYLGVGIDDIHRRVAAGELRPELPSFIPQDYRSVGGSPFFGAAFCA